MNEFRNDKVETSLKIIFIYICIHIMVTARDSESIGKPKNKN